MYLKDFSSREIEMLFMFLKGKCQVQAEEIACQLNLAGSTASLKNTQLDLCYNFAVAD